MREVTGSSPVSSTKTKGNCFCSCLLFWVPAAEGGLHPSVFECSGRRSRPCAKVFPCGENTCTAHPRRQPEGRVSAGLFTYRELEHIQIVVTSQNKRQLLLQLPFILGSGRPKAASTLRYLNARGGGAAPAPRFSPAVKTLVRRTRAAGQKIGWVQACPLTGNLNISKLSQRLKKPLFSRENSGFYDFADRRSSEL